MLQHWISTLVFLGLGITLTAFAKPPKESDLPRLSRESGNRIVDSLDDGYWIDYRWSQRNEAGFAKYFLYEIGDYTPFMLYNSDSLRLTGAVTRYIAVRSWKDFLGLEPMVRSDEFLSATDTLAQIRDRLRAADTQPGRLTSQSEIDTYYTPVNQWPKAEAAVTEFCRKLAFSPECRSATMALLLYSKPYGDSDGLQVVGYRGFSRFISSAIYVKGFARFGAEVAERMRLELLGAQTPPSSVFDDLMKSFVGAGMNKLDAQDATMLALQTYSARGASYLSERFSRQNDLTQLALSMLMSGISFLDRIQISRGQAPYFLPSTLHAKSVYGKPYHFWLAAALTYFASRTGHSPATNSAAVFGFGVMYELIQDANGRDVTALVSRSEFGPELNQARLDVAYKAAGTQFGKQLSSGRLNSISVDKALAYQFRQSGRTPQFVLKKFGQLLSDVPGLSADVASKWINLVAPFSSYLKFEIAGGVGAKSKVRTACDFSEDLKQILEITSEDCKDYPEGSRLPMFTYCMGGANGDTKCFPNSDRLPGFLDEMKGFQISDIEFQALTGTLKIPTLLASSKITSLSLTATSGQFEIPSPLFDTPNVDLTYLNIDSGSTRLSADFVRNMLPSMPALSSIVFLGDFGTGCLDISGYTQLTYLADISGIVCNWKALSSFQKLETLAIKNPQPLPIDLSDLAPGSFRSVTQFAVNGVTSQIKFGSMVWPSLQRLTFDQYDAQSLPINWPDHLPGLTEFAISRAPDLKVDPLDVELDHDHPLVSMSIEHSSIQSFRPNTKFKVLENVSYSTNSITDLDGEICDRLPKLTRIDFSYGKIRTLTSNTFAGCNGQTSFSLWGNPVDILPSTLFDRMKIPPTPSNPIHLGLDPSNKKVGAGLMERVIWATGESDFRQLNLSTVYYEGDLCSSPDSVALSQIQSVRFSPDKIAKELPCFQKSTEGLIWDFTEVGLADFPSPIPANAHFRVLNLSANPKIALNMNRWPQGIEIENLVWNQNLVGTQSDIRVKNALKLKNLTLEVEADFDFNAEMFESMENPLLVTFHGGKSPSRTTRKELADKNVFLLKVKDN